MNIYIIHGWGGSPESDWIPWLKRELEDQGYNVIVPAMPDTDAPEINVWVGYLKEIVKNPDSNTFFVGHSNGCQAVMRYLDSSEVKIGGALFIAGWFNLKNLEDEEVPIAEPWITTSMDFDEIKGSIGNLRVILSDNDPYDCLQENKEKFEKLGGQVIIVPGAGHFAGDDGTTELPLARNILFEMMAI